MRDVHAGVGRADHDAPGRADPRDGAGDGRGEARRRRPPRPPRHLVRRRHAARAGDGDPDRAPRQLRPQGRPLPPHPRARGRLRAARLPRLGEGPGRRGRRDAIPLASEEMGVTNGLVDATLSGKPYPIKAWIVYAQNVLESIPQPQQTLKAIESLDFLCVVDVLPVDQVAYADLVLPEATYLERYDAPLIVNSAKTPFVSVRQPVVEPLHESKPGWWIAKELAKRLGLEAFFPWATPEEHLAKIVEPMEINPLELRTQGRRRVRRPAVHRGPDGGRRPALRHRQRQDRALLAGPQGPRRRSAAALHAARRAAGGLPPPHLRPRAHALVRADAEQRDAPRPDARERGVAAHEAGAGARARGRRPRPARERRRRRRACRCACASPRASATTARTWSTASASGRSRLRRARDRGASDTQLMTRVKVDPLMGGTGMRVNFVRPVTAAGGKEA